MKDKYSIEITEDGILIAGHYLIESNRIDAKEKLVEWIYHLSEKTWFTTTFLRDFMQCAAELNGWKIYGYT